MIGYITITHNDLQKLLDKVQNNIIVIRKQKRIKGLKRFVKYYNKKWWHRLFGMKLWLITEKDFEYAEQILNTYINDGYIDVDCGFIQTYSSCFYSEFKLGFNIYSKIQKEIVDKLNRVLKYNIKFQELFLDIETLSDLNSIMETEINEE